ncbi:MAG: hypothetical protein MUF24_08635 [Chitinophagaceae bacterium]|nr:hypothetical protein [Chitinophagaceae bacterium]
MQLALANLQTIQHLPKKGIRLIFTTPDIKLLIPDTLEHFEELLQKLENIKPVEPFSLATNEKQLVMLRLAGVTGFLGVLFIEETMFLWLAGVFTICVYSYLLFRHHKMQQSLNTSNKISWPLLLPLIFTVLLLSSKLW